MGTETSDAAGAAVEAIIAGLRTSGVIPRDAEVEVEMLTGGVSSDVRRVSWPGDSAVVKAALPRLRVDAVWEAPLERSENEVRWLRCARSIVDGAVPEVLADDPGTHAFAMEDLAGAPTWKAELAAGHCDPGFAATVGTLLARIHSATASDPATPGAFDTEILFRALRVHPYLEAAAQARPEVAGPLRAIATDLLATRRALVHGDLSPKNVLVAERGPVFVDAETAWWGDPAFDVAFANTHLLLKARWHPEFTTGFSACRDAFTSAHAAGVDWEDAAALDARAARLVPALLLARVDGKSPVEYLADADRVATREFAMKALLAGLAGSTAEVAQTWYDDAGENPT